MSKRKHILLEMSFWKEFSKRYTSLCLSLDKKTIEELTTWLDLWSFLSRSHLIINCTKEGFEIATHSDQNLALLWKKNASGECRIEFKQELVDNIEDAIIQYPTALLLSNTDKSEIASLYGIININTNNYPSNHFLFKDSGPAIRKGQRWTWEAIREYLSLPSNSLVIVDNFLFKETTNNLYAILNIILPNSLPKNIKYHITLFSSQVYQYNEEELVKFISKERPNIKDSIDVKCIKANQSDFHDRAFITNNMWLGCEGGFDLLKKDNTSSKSTKIHIVFPYLASDNIRWSDKAYEDLIDDANKVLTNTQNTANNRLLNRFN